MITMPKRPRPAIRSIANHILFGWWDGLKLPNMLGSDPAQQQSHNERQDESSDHGKQPPRQTPLPLAFAVRRRTFVRLHLTSMERRQLSVCAQSDFRPLHWPHLWWRALRRWFLPFPFSASSLRGFRAAHPLAYVFAPYPFPNLKARRAEPMSVEGRPVMLSGS